MSYPLDCHMSVHSLVQRMCTSCMSHGHDAASISYSWLLIFMPYACAELTAVVIARESDLLVCIVRTGVSVRLNGHHHKCAASLLEQYCHTELTNSDRRLRMPRARGFIRETNMCHTSRSRQIATYRSISINWSPNVSRVSHADCHSLVFPPASSLTFPHSLN